MHDLPHLSTREEWRYPDLAPAGRSLLRQQGQAIPFSDSQSTACIIALTRLSIRDALFIFVRCVEQEQCVSLFRAMCNRYYSRNQFTTKQNKKIFTKTISIWRTAGYKTSLPSKWNLPAGQTSLSRQIVLQVWSRRWPGAWKRNRTDN